MNRSVNVSQGLKKFFFYLFLSGCLGLFGNHYIQKKLRQFWEPVAVQLRESGVQLSAPRMVFSRHWLPVLGARIDNVRFEQEVQCFSGAITVENVFVPFSVYQLLSQKLRVGEVEVESLKFQFIEAAGCAKKGSLPDEQALVEVAQKAVEKTMAPVKGSIEKSAVKLTESPAWFSYFDRWFKDRDKILSKNPVSSLAIRSLILEARTLEGKEMTALGKAYIDFKNGAAADVHLTSLVLRKKERSLSTEFKAEVHAEAENIQVKGDWAFHGGHFITDIKYNKEQTFKVALESRDLPVGVVNKWFDTPWSFQFLWFNCQLQLEGKKDDWSQIPWTAKSCRMNGPSGDITLINETLSSLKKPKEASFKITQLDLDKIIFGRDNLPLSGVFKGFGQLDGVVDLKNDEWEMKVELSNSQVVFSSENRRKLQTVDQMKFSGGYTGNIYSIKLLAAEIRNGEFDGMISADYNSRANSGEGRLNVQKLSFDESIEDLMFAGQVSSLAAVGDFSISNKALIEKAQLRINFKDFKGTNIDLNMVNVVGQWSEEKLETQATAAQVKILQNGTGRWVIGSLLNKADLEKDSLTLTQAQGHGTVSSPLQVKLESFTAQTNLKSGPLRLQASGVYDYKSMEGSWRWFDDENAILQWKWRGKNRQILLVPQLPRMKEWLRDNGDFQRDNAYIYLEDKDI